MTVCSAREGHLRFPSLASLASLGRPAHLRSPYTIIFGPPSAGSLTRRRAPLPGATSSPIPAYDATTIQTIFVTSLATATGTTANVVTPVRLKTDALPLHTNTIALLVAQTSAVDPTQFPSLINAFTSVAKAAALFKLLKPTEAEFAFVMQNAVTFNWLDPGALPLSPVVPSPYLPFERLLRALEINKRQPARTPRLFDILSQWLPPNPLPPDLATAIGGPAIDNCLALALNASVNDVVAVATALGATPPSLTSAMLTGSLSDVAMLASIVGALDVAARYGISGATLVQLSTVPANSDTASAAMGALQIQYPRNAWFAAIQQVEDALRQSRRDALVAYLLGPGPAAPVPPLLTTDDIFNYYLIDPEMCPCALMTRLLQASLAIQQFVQQCFLNIFFSSVQVDMSNPHWSEWQWRQQYRLWQANHEVFLYPENYVLPELRKDASPFFSDLENGLRQSNCDADAAEAAIENYIRKLVSVARLHVAAHYNETKPDGSTLLHVFAFTQGTPPQWYYRKRTGMTSGAGAWSPWEPLTLDIASQQVLPVVWDGRLYLVWPVFNQFSEKQKDQPVPPQGGGAPQPAPEKFWAVEFAMSEFSGGQWQAKRTITERMFFVDLLPLRFTFRASQDPSFNLQIDVFQNNGSTHTGSGTLSVPDAPMSVIESSYLPDAELIDLSREPTYALVLTQVLPQYLPTPPTYVFWGQDLVYGTVSPHATQILGTVPLDVLCQTTNSAKVPPVSIELLGTIANPRIVVPMQEPVFDSADPFFVADPSCNPTRFSRSISRFQALR